MPNITVLNASADTSFHASLRTALDHQEEISLLDAVWDNEAQLLRVARDLKPDVFLMDRQFQGDDEAPLLPRIHAASPGTKTILFCDFFGHREVVEAIVHGAKGCIRKTSAPAQWLKAIRVIHGGDIWVDRKLLVQALEGLLHQSSNKFPSLESKPAILTEREWEVVRWVGQGMTNKEIARQMAISDTTVKTHLQHIFNKLKVGRRLLLPNA